MNKLTLLGKKIGMTQVFDENHTRIPVTAIEAGPVYVLGTKTKEKDGRSALILGFEDKKEKSCNKPELGFFKKIKITPKKFIKEITVPNDPEYKIGDTLDVNIFAEGTFINITGTSKGKGFQGGVRRWGWKGGEASHGSNFHRTIGSVSASSFPSRIFKGHRMPGHMGNVKVTIKNLKVIKVIKEKNIILVRGAVPGHRDTYLVIVSSLKKPSEVKKVAQPATEKKQTQQGQQKTANKK